MEGKKLGESGLGIMEIQAVLKKLGYNIGKVDGVFEAATLRAVIEFQIKHELIPNGVIGRETEAALRAYMLGIERHVMRPGDTQAKLAMWFGVAAETIAAANRGVEFDKLGPGETVLVPYNFNVVDDIDYSYSVLERNIEGLVLRYPFLKVGIAGKSVLGKKLYTISIGEGRREIFFNGAHHALEWITTPLLMKFLEEYSRSWVMGGSIGGYNARELFETSTLRLMPMVNPDGVDMVISGLARQDNPYFGMVVGCGDNLSGWQANIRGVDLNHNYDAGWAESTEAAQNLGITGPGPTRYGGPKPESEPETQAVVRYTKEHDFDMVMAFHSQGEEIYWNFRDYAPPEAQTIGRRLAELSGYTLSSPSGIAGYAGYKDWFLQEYRRPGYTIEVGRGQNPLPLGQLEAIYARISGMMAFVLSEEAEISLS